MSQSVQQPIATYGLLGDAGHLSTILRRRSAHRGFARAGEDWTKVFDMKERRKIQNRIAQRIYRQKIKRRMEDLEHRSTTPPSSTPSLTSSPAPTTHATLYTPMPEEIQTPGLQSRGSWSSDMSQPPVLESQCWEEVTTQGKPRYCVPPVLNSGYNLSEYNLNQLQTMNYMTPPPNDIWTNSVMGVEHATPYFPAFPSPPISSHGQDSFMTMPMSFPQCESPELTSTFGNDAFDAFTNSWLLSEV